MPTKEVLEKYAHLLVRGGCNIQPGQELYVSADVEQAPLVRAIVAQAYAAGASNVTTYFTDEQVSRMGYQNKPLESFREFPEWRALLQNGVAKRGAALLFFQAKTPWALPALTLKKSARFKWLPPKRAAIGATAWILAETYG